MTDQLVERYMDLFTGLQSQYGLYTRVTEKRGDGKLEGQAVTHRGLVTSQLWSAHLYNGVGLGIIVICEDNSCRFGAIDIDIYPFADDEKTLLPLIKLIRSNDLPLIPIRSKSGGVQLYVFTSEPVPAWLMRERLKQWAALLGHAKNPKTGIETEIFPKQAEILLDRDDSGSWINMPYCKGMEGGRYAFDNDGKPIPFADFPNFAEKYRASLRLFQDYQPPSCSDFTNGPPCLQHLVTGGVPEGGRNNGLFNIGVYLQRSDPEHWEKRLEEYNHKVMNPPLGSADVQNIAKSLKKKEYFYTCEKPPISQFCDKETCKKREFGIGTAEAQLPSFGTLRKVETSPPTWFWDIDGTTVEFTTDELQSPLKFQKRCMEAINRLFVMPKGGTWLRILQRALDSMPPPVALPDDATEDGILFDWLERFCSTKSQGRSLDELSVGKPFKDTETGYIYFRLPDFLRFLQRNQVKDFNQRKLVNLFRAQGLQNGKKNLSGRCVSYWVTDAFASNVVPLGIPKGAALEEHF